MTDRKEKKKSAGGVKEKYGKRTAAILTVIGVGVVIYLVLLQILFRIEAMEQQEQNNERFFSATISNLRSNNREIVNLTQNFDDNNKIMLDNIVEAYSGEDYKEIEMMTPEEQSELLESATESMEDCKWMFMVDRDGKIIISSIPENNGLSVIDDGEVGITLKEFHELCDGDVENIIVDNPYYGEKDEVGTKLYLYCKPIRGSYGPEGYRYIMTGIASDIIDTAKNSIGDPSVWLNGSTIGNNASVLMADASADKVLYGEIKGKDQAGKKASEMGLSSQILTNDFTGWTKLGGVRCYVSVREFFSDLYGNSNYIIIAAPMLDMHGLRTSVIIWNICLFLIFALLVLAYSSFVRYEAVKNDEDLREIVLFKGTERETAFSRELAAKTLPVIATAAVIFFCASFYFQALMKLSESFSESVGTEKEISSAVEQSSRLRDDFTNYYDMQYANRARLISFIISLNCGDYLNADKDSENVNPAGRVDVAGNLMVMKDDYNNTVYVINNSEKLKRLNGLNDVRDIYLFSDRGVMIGTSSNILNHTLSRNAGDQSEEFWDILEGRTDVVIQQPGIDDQGNFSQYIGYYMNYYTRLDEKGDTEYVDYSLFLKQQDGDYKGNEITAHRGLIQLQLDPEDGNGVMESSKPDYILSNTKISHDGVLIGFEENEDGSDYTVFYSQIPSLKGRSASEIELSDRAFSGSYNGFQWINGVRYLQSIRKAGDYYISTAIPVSSLYDSVFHSSLSGALYLLVILLIISSFTLFSKKTGEEEQYSEEHDPLAILRVLHTRNEWDNSTHTRRFELLIAKSLAVLGVVFLASIIYEAYRQGSNSAVVYIISGEWDRGIHIFSISACVVLGIVTALLIRVIENVTCLIASVFGSRIMTIIKLFLSIVKAAVVVVVVLYCLFLMGIDATRLLASAGIMSVVVGLGAQSLVGDILAGIFLVMEGSIHVGDYVLINDIRGRITEIGLRTTRYEDINQNIRIIGNNEMKSFANMSMKYSVVFYYIPVPYDEDYPGIRKLLNREFIALYEENKALKGIPSCLGIQQFSESSVDLCVKFMCEEGDRLDVQRYMYDQIMRIFMENGISVPFNQLDVHIEREFSDAERIRYDEGTGSKGGDTYSRP